MPVLVEPLGLAAERRMRALVLDLRLREPRVRFPTRVHLGDPPGEVVHQLRAEETLDSALRIEVLASLLVRVAERERAPLVWLARPGDLVTRDCDVDWLRGASAAYAEADLPLTFVVVTRCGWIDPRSGISRTWRRLRDRRPSRRAPRLSPREPR